MDEGRAVGGERGNISPVSVSLGVDREGDDRGNSSKTYRQTGSDVHVQGGVHDGIRIASDVSIFVCRVPFIAHVWREGGREEKGCPSGGAERGSSRARASLSRGTREVVGKRTRRSVSLPQVVLGVPTPA